MSIFRRKHPKTGKRSRFYSAEFAVNGKQVRKGGFVDRESAKHWRDSELMKLRRGLTGYVKPMLKAQVKPLVEQFCEQLRAKGRSHMYCYTAEQRLNRLVGECGWQTIGDITRQSLEAWMNADQVWRKKIIGPKTKNQFADIAVEFGKWLASNRVQKLPSNPLREIEKLQAKNNDTYRRAGTVKEINQLLASCPADRRLYYTFRLYCPLRGRTIAGLTWDMLKLDATPPWIALPAEINKSKRDERSPLRYDIAAQLRKVKGRAKASDAVFENPPTIDDFKADLAAAGVPFDDGKGNRRLDFHALRKTLVRLLKASGVSLDQASLILHHKDPRTTRKHYDDDAVAPELGDAMERLPELGKMKIAE